MEDATCVEAAPLPLYRILEPDGWAIEALFVMIDWLLLVYTSLLLFTP